MTDDGVFLNPDSGDIIATGQISAQQFKVSDKNDILVGNIPFIDIISVNVPTKVSDLSNDLNFTVSSDFNFSYNSVDKKIYLKAQGAEIGNVDCVDFIKDGMLSTVQLCGNVLVLVFNTDAGKNPISVNLSSFGINYDDKISALSDDIADLQENKLDPEDLIPVYEDLLSPDEVKLYKGPGLKDITLSVGTGTYLCTYTASLSDFYLASETSSASQISGALENKVIIRTWTI